MTQTSTATVTAAKADTAVADTTFPAGDPRPPVVELTGLTKTFPGRGRTPAVEAVRGVDLTIRAGEVVALLGPNGAGKTTTLEAVLGFTEPTSGSVRVLSGTPGDAVASGRVSSVLQSGGLLPGLSVGETLRLVASLFEESGGGRHAASHREAHIAAVATRAGLDGLLQRRVGKCSGGEQQRLRFALALLPDPDLLILDEPTAGLDVVGRRVFWDAIRQDAARGRTIVFATHYLAEADDIADRLVLLSGGRVVADGPVDEVKASALGRRVRVRVAPTIDATLAADPQVTELERHGDVLTFTTLASDAAAHLLLTTTDAHDLEIEPQSLDDAFVALTQAGPAAAAR